MECQWKLSILGELRLRNQKESGGFTELIISHAKLQDQLETARKEITRLEYENNELEKKDLEGTLTSTSGTGGDGVSSKEVAKLRKKVEELSGKMMSKQEEIIDKQTKLMEATDELRKTQDEMKKLEGNVKDLESTKGRLEKEVSELKSKQKEKDKTHQALKDEFQALQASSASTEAKLADLETEYDELKLRLIQIKSQQADELNTANEIIRKKRDKKLEEEIRKASEEKEPLIGAGGGGASGHHHRKTSEKRRINSIPADAEEAPGPSINPTTPHYTYDAHDSEVSALCFSSDGNYMATGGADKLVKIWNWRPSQDKMELKFTLRGCTQSIMSIQFDQTARQVLTASNDSSARIFNVLEEKTKHTLTGHGNRVMAAKFMEDNMKVVTGSHDRTLKLWDLQHKACIRTMFAGSSCNDVVAGRGLGNTVISGHFDKRIRFWDTRTATANEIALQGKVTSLDHFPDRHLLLCCSRDDALRLIDLRQNSIVATYNANGFRVSVDWTRACFSPDGQYVAAGSSDGSLFVWDTMGGKQKREKCREHVKEVVVCSWHPKGQLFATADRHKKVTIWKR